MNVNKKLDRFKQWAGEKMGGEVKTSVSDDFKALEVEMALRHEGMLLQSTHISAELRTLKLNRNGTTSEVYDNLYQDAFEAE